MISCGTEYPPLPNSGTVLAVLALPGLPSLSNNQTISVLLIPDETKTCTSKLFTSHRLPGIISKSKKLLCLLAESVYFDSVINLNSCQVYHCNWKYWHKNTPNSKSVGEKYLINVLKAVTSFYSCLMLEYLLSCHFSVKVTETELPTSLLLALSHSLFNSSQQV